MTGRRRIVLIDTNIIIEAKRTVCWHGLRGHYALVTVEKCWEEARSGVGRTPGYVEVTDDDLTGMQIAKVTDADRAQLIAACPDAQLLDAGERDLWAHANSREGDWEAACADQAAVRVAVQLGWERLVSLEELLRSAGITPKRKLKAHYTKRKLEAWRTNFKLGM